MNRSLCLFVVLAVATVGLNASGLPVSAPHPRILLTPEIKTRLLAKKNGSDPAWTRLKARADLLATYAIYPYKYSSRTSEPDNTIFYDYQGEGWFFATLPLALAYQMTGDATYSGKLLQLADEMIRAQSDPDNNPPNGYGPLEPDNYYPTRNLCPTLAIIYDWCYDVLGASRKAAMLTLMNAYFDDLRANAYQRNDHADGNFFTGHLIATASMGYASFGDNARAQEMIDYARIRFDKSPSPLIDQAHTPDDFFTQLFDGGTRPEIARDYNGPSVSGAPFKGGFDFQGWAYGTATYDHIIDYMLMVKSATTEDLVTPHSAWFSQVFRAEKELLMPDRFATDPSGDYGSDYGPAVNWNLPMRLAYVLAGTSDGPGAQHFVMSELAASSPYAEFPDYVYDAVFKPSEWVTFFFADSTRPSAELVLPPYYTGFAPAYPAGGQTNGAVPYFWMRSGWGTDATWASFHLGAAWWDDHQHADAGHLEIKRGGDYLLVDASNFKGATGSTGLVGSSLDEEYAASAVSNTLHFNDFGTFQRTDMNFEGGQGIWGKDEIVAAELTNQYSYARSDLSSAYDRSGDPADQAGRGLDYFYRSIFYLRQAGDLFVVFDEVKAKPSTAAAGQYRKHLRWHFPNRPTSGALNARVVQGASSLNMDVLLPPTATLTLVDESNNPDPCDGSVTPCTPYGMNSGTWRAEVRDPANPLFSRFLTVLQPGAAAAAKMSTSPVWAADSGMVGARVVLPTGAVHLVLFNNGPGQVPAPPATVSYQASGAAQALHTLGGMKPGAAYAVTIADPSVTVKEDVAGTVRASAAGVLQFGQGATAVNEAAARVPAAFVLGQNYPNPFNPSTTIRYGVPADARVSLIVFNTLGQKVAVLVDGEVQAGYHELMFDASRLASGVYFYRLEAVASAGNGTYTAVKQLVLVR